MPKYINISKDKVPSEAPLDDINWCPCGRLIVNEKCTRKYPIKACKGEVMKKRKRYAGFSKFYENKGYQEI